MVKTHQSVCLSVRPFVARPLAINEKRQKSLQRLTVITAARRNGRVPRRPQGRCSPRQL